MSALKWTYRIPALPVKALILAVCLMLCGQHLHAQTPDKWTEKGHAALAAQHYPEAMEYFQWSLRKDTSFSVAEGMAKCHHALGDYKQSLHWWKIAVGQPDHSKESYYEYARMLLSNSRPEEAGKWFEKYFADSPEDPRAKYYENVAQWLPQMFLDSSDYAVSRVKSNSKYADIGSGWVGNTILISSNRPSEVAVIHAGNTDGLPLLDVYSAVYDSTKGFMPAKPVSELNTKFHDGPASYSPANQLLAINRNDREVAQEGSKGQDDPVTISLYQMVNGKWEFKEKMPWDGFSAVHPAWSPDGKKLYYASKKPGGQGAYDIWFRTYSDGQWGEPVNAGPDLNTSGNETYPSLQVDGTLFFASDGHPGIGGLDIFFSKADESGQYLRPVNPGIPLNSIKDDFGFQPRNDGSHGIFTTNRNLGMGDDVWEYKRTRPEFECQPQQENVYCFRFWETGSIETDTLPLFYSWDMGDGTILRGLEVYHCFDGPGDYIVQLNLVDSTSGFIFLNEATYEMNIKDIVQPFIQAPEAAAVKETVLFDGKKSTLENCIPEKYFWDFGDGQKGQGVTVPHIYKKPGIYDVELGITGRKEGSSEACQACVSKKIEIQSQEEFIKTQDSIRRKQEAEMFTRPEATKPPKALPSVDTSGTQVRDIRDSSNVDFKVKLAEAKKEIPLSDPLFSKLDRKQDIKVIKGDSTFSYLYGSKETRTSIYAYYDEARKKGFSDAIVVAFKGEKAISGSDSTFTVQIPAKVLDGNRIVVFSGKVLDQNGKPLEAVMTIEDLVNRVEVVRINTDDKGAFRLKLPDGQIYGYYVEAQGYFPYSDYLDLRLNKTDNNEVVINQNLTMLSIKEIVNKGSAVRINNIFFDYDKSELRPESYKELYVLADMLKENPSVRVEVLGHTDAEGDATYNNELSKRRAEAVASFLKGQGLGKQLIRTIGYGELVPIATNDTPEGRQLNRRVEFRLLK